MEGKWGKPPQQGQEPENQPTSADMPAPHSQPSRTPLKAAAGAAAPGTPAPPIWPSPPPPCLLSPLHSFTEHILPELSIYWSFFLIG